MSNEKPFKLDMGFTEALRRLVQTDPKEILTAKEELEKKDQDVDQFIRERERSIRAGARRAGKKFRL